MGFKPNEVLDLTYSQYCACLRGFTKVSKDHQAFAAQTGFYCAYFAMSKNPKSLQTILKEIYAESKIQKHMDTVDVEAFLKRKQQFEENQLLWQQQIKRQKS